jgi:hypothetical protein
LTLRRRAAVEPAVPQRKQLRGRRSLLRDHRRRVAVRSAALLLVAGVKLLVMMLRRGAGNVPEMMEQMAEILGSVRLLRTALPLTKGVFAEIPA